MSLSSIYGSPDTPPTVWRLCVRNCQSHCWAWYRYGMPKVEHACRIASKERWRVATIHIRTYVHAFLWINIMFIIRLIMLQGRVWKGSLCNYTEMLIQGREGTLCNLINVLHYLRKKKAFHGRRRSVPVPSAAAAAAALAMAGILPFPLTTFQVCLLYPPSSHNSSVSVASTSTTQFIHVVLEPSPKWNRWTALNIHIGIFEMLKPYIKNLESKF